MWDARYREKELLWSAGPNQFVAEYLGDLPPGRAIDVACGEGRNTIWLAARGWEVTAVDFSGVALDRGRRLAPARRVDVEWVEADVLTWEAPQVYDLVLIAYLHLPSRPRQMLMAKATSWVGPGGHLFLVGHDVSTAGVSGPPDPDLLWDTATARSLAAPLEVVTVDRRTRLTDTGATAADTVLLARREAGT